MYDLYILTLVHIISDIKLIQILSHNNINCFGNKIDHVD